MQPGRGPAEGLGRARRPLPAGSDEYAPRLRKDLDVELGEMSLVAQWL